MTPASPQGRGNFIDPAGQPPPGGAPPNERYGQYQVAQGMNVPAQYQQQFQTSLQQLPGWAGYLQWLQAMQPKTQPIFGSPGAGTSGGLATAGGPFVAGSPGATPPTGGWQNPNYFNPFTRPIGMPGGPPQRGPI